MNSQREEHEKRMNEIESQIAQVKITVSQCFTQMKQMVQSTWQAATEQGVGESVAWREYTVQSAESLAGIAVRQLGDESRAGEIGLLNNLVWEDVGLYPFNPGDVIKLPVPHPPKPTGGGVPEGSGFDFARRSLSKNLETWPDDARNAITDGLKESSTPKGFVKKHKLDQVAEAANRFEDIQAETIQRLRDDLRTAHLYQSDDEDRPVWYWQGDGYDHTESLVSDAVVVIRADQLRALLATQQPPEQDTP